MRKWEVILSRALSRIIREGPCGGASSDSAKRVWYLDAVDIPDQVDRAGLPHEDVQEQAEEDKHRAVSDKDASQGQAVGCPR